jgi:ferredoxin
MTVKVRIEKELCTGEGVCEEICPEIFRVSEDDDIAKIIKSGFDDIDEACISEAAESCPGAAIIIEYD